MPQSRSLRILIVDDDPHFLDALEALFARAERVEVVGRATNGVEAVRRTAELVPDAITMDIDMPIMDGVEATQMIVKALHVPVVMVSASQSPERIDEALAAGASAHVYKACPSDDLSQTIRAAVAQAPH
jgi:two-component system chemotaxis response regulator CheB